MSENLPASVRARLLNLAKAEGSDFNGVLVRYALERLLYRMSQSAHADKFLLKGALLFTLWYDMPHRPTRDVDLLGFGSSDMASIERTFREIAAIEADDGIVFDHTSISVQQIRKEAGYAGARVIIAAELSRARCKAQIDIGFGDAVTPGPVSAVYPVLLSDFPAPHLRTYPIYSVVAEKLHAIALLGMTNSRLKDYLDLLGDARSRSARSGDVGDSHLSHVHPSRHGHTCRSSDWIERRVRARSHASGTVAGFPEEKRTASNAVARSDEDIDRSSASCFEPGIAAFRANGPVKTDASIALFGRNEAARQTRKSPGKEKRARRWSI